MEMTGILFSTIFVVLIVVTSAQDQPKIVPIMSRVLLENSRFNTMCTTLQGSLPLEFNWLKNGNPLDDSVKIASMEDTSSIRINEVTANSGGNYTCTVKNAFGSDSFAFTINVQSLPKWVKEPSDILAAVGSKVQSTCLASGYPQPTIVWQRFDGKNNALVRNGVLEFESLDEDDTGTYECVVSNNEGQVLKKAISVKVFVPAKFETKFSMITGKRGESVKLECPASGDQPLSVSWTKENVKFDKRGGENYEIFDQTREKGINSELILRSVERKDSAIYKCITKNDHGSDERTIKLVVLEVPAAPTNLRVKEVWSRSASLVWTPPFTGNSPISKYTIQYWRKQNAPHRLNEVTILSTQTSAIIDNLQPGLSYEVTITAENDVGRGETSESVNFVTGEEEPSAAPVDIFAESRGSRTILISWKAPPQEHWNGQIKGFYVGYKSRDSQQPYSYRTVEAKHGTSHLTQSYEFFLSNLLKGTAYIVTVKAFNTAGSGPPSQEVIVHLLAGDLPGAPHLYIISSESNSVSLRWNIKDATVQLQHPITGYSIHFQKDNDQWREVPVSSISTAAGSTAAALESGLSNGSGDQTRTTMALSSNTYTLSNLESGSKYHIYVTASNRFGTGDPSNVVTVSTDGNRVQYTPANIDSINMAEIPYFAQPMVIIPILCTIVIVCVVSLVTFVCVKRMSPPVPDYAGFNTLSRQFTYTGTQQVVDPKSLMDGNPFPAPYATVQMQLGENGDPWDRPLPNPKSHIYDNPQ